MLLFTWYAQAELTCSNANANAEYPYVYGQNYRKVTYILSMGKKSIKITYLGKFNLKTVFLDRDVFRF